MLGILAILPTALALPSMLIWCEAADDELEAKEYKRYGECPHQSPTREIVVNSTASPEAFLSQLNDAFSARRHMPQHKLGLSLQSPKQSRLKTYPFARGKVPMALRSYGLLNYGLSYFVHPDAVGWWLEFGVFNGRSINVTRFFLNDAINVVGFDTFNGLPALGHRKSFSLGGVVPPVFEGVRLEQGLFRDTLPGFVEGHKGIDVVGMNIDCDLYTGSLEALILSHSFFRTGTLIHFHEIARKKDTGPPTDEARALFDYLRACQGTVVELLPVRTDVKAAALFRHVVNPRGANCDQSKIAADLAAAQQASH